MADNPTPSPDATVTSTLVQTVGKSEPTLMDKAQVGGTLLMVVVSLLVVSALAWQGNEQAQGALIGVVSAGVGYFLRGRVEKQG